MAGNPDRHTDHTHLDVEKGVERGLIHRDLLAHSLRWSHVIDFILKHTKPGDPPLRILDIGCGRQVPLAKAIYSNRLGSRVEYTGVDDRKDLDTSFLSAKATWAPTFHAGQGIVQFQTDQKYDVIVCFEMLEHVRPHYARLTLRKIRSLLADGGTAFVSTPVWDVKHTADNHINEMRFETLGHLIESEDFQIERVTGTFASQSDYKQGLTPEVRAIFEKLNSYYNADIVSIMMAPLIDPKDARNALWELTRFNESRMFQSSWANIPKPWSSSDYSGEFEE